MSSPMSSPSARRAPRLADAALSRARLTVVPRVRARAPRVPFVLLVSLLLAGGVVGLLMFNTSMQQASFAVSELEDEAAHLAAQEQSLSVEVESLRNPQRLAERAQAMGMVLPASSCFVVLSGAQPDCDSAAATPELLRLHPRPPVKPARLDPDPIVVRADAEAQGKKNRNGTAKNRKTEHQKTKNRRDTGSTSPSSGSARDRNGGTSDRGNADRAGQ
jgi:cell division protein FtsL